MYIEEIENSDLSTEAKMISLLNAKKTLKKLRIRRILPEIKRNAKEGTDFSEKSGVSEEWFDRVYEFGFPYVSSEKCN